MDDYRSITGRLREEALASVAYAPPIGRGLRRWPRKPAVGALDVVLLEVVGGLEPRIAAVCRDLVADDHLPQAVLKAAGALRELLREKSGLSSDGVSLAGDALSPKGGPVVVVADVTTDTGWNIQQGTMFLAQGVFARIRNVLVHEDVDLEAGEALEMLATISLVARRVSRAEGPAA